MKTVLIISPYFPPSNAADMHRVRTSLPYFKQFGWDAEIVCVDEKYSNMVQDELLVNSLPPGLVVYKVDALPQKWTSKLGFGALGFRSFWFYLKKVNNLLRSNKYDLIYFSTTQFPVCVLGAYWKNKFGIPYVIDMQDPWYSNYYKSKPKRERPPKFRAIYGIHKKLEAIAMKNVDGLISVSDHYINDLKARYPTLTHIPSATITFGSFEPDIKIAAANQNRVKSLLLPGFKNIVYVGRGGLDMHKAISPVFEALKKGIATEPELFAKFKFYFIGTSYAPGEQGVPTIKPLAVYYEVENMVIEITQRISYYHTLLTLQQADALFVPGSSDPKYTASKIYPYLLTQKPLLAIFNSQSSAIDILREYGVKNVYGFDNKDDIIDKVSTFLKRVIGRDIEYDQYNQDVVEKYTAETLTGNQCQLFDAALDRKI